MSVSGDVSDYSGRTVRIVSRHAKGWVEVVLLAFGDNPMEFYESIVAKGSVEPGSTQVTDVCAFGPVPKSDWAPVYSRGLTTEEMIWRDGLEFEGIPDVGDLVGLALPSSYGTADARQAELDMYSAAARSSEANPWFDVRVCAGHFRYWAVVDSKGGKQAFLCIVPVPWDAQIGEIIRASMYSLEEASGGRVAQSGAIAALVSLPYPRDAMMLSYRYLEKAVVVPSDL